MKKEDIAYYSILFVAGASMAWYFHKQYLKLKNAPKVTGKAVAFGVRG
jgi:hypothetical protein